MHYLLYVPVQVGTSIGTPQQALENLGLGDMIPGHEGIPSRGPEEAQQGHLIAWKRPGKNDRLHFNANEQTWIPAVANGPDGEGKGRYWVGFWNDSPVTPEDLQRPYSHRGTMLELGDGNQWRLPVLKELPRDAILADDGTWKFELQRQYHDLVREADDIFNCAMSGKPQDLGKLAAFVCRWIAQNYRLIPEVASHLKLLDTENIELAICSILSQGDDS